MVKIQIFVLCLLLCSVFMDINAGELVKRRKRMAWASIGPKPENSSCLFSCPPGWCYNGGNCSVSEIDCSFKCACDEGFSDSRCNTTTLSSSTTPEVDDTVVATTEATEVTTLRSIDVRRCFPGFDCEHGYCDRDNGIACACDEGWTGVFCEKQEVCTLECESGTVCKRIQNTYVCVQLAPSSTIQSTAEVQTIPTEPTATRRTSTTGSTSTINQTIHTSYGTTARPLSERTCFPGFVCYRGYCNKYGFYRCVCDPGWKGPFCDKTTCSPECDDDAECKDVSGTPTCVTKLRPTTTTPVTTTDEECPGFNYTMRPDEERECVPGYKCKYGKCKTTDKSNGVDVECICDEGAYGSLCESKCCLNCSGHGKCGIFNDTQVCLCEYRDTYKYTGEFCEIKVQTRVPPKESTWYLWVVGVCAVVFVFLILLLVVMPYWMWRNRVTVVMKIVHFFQPYEDDDDRVWDAFISYKSSGVDETFVLKQLYPKLEKELGFKLCMHQRDFVPGETIANNIINAVNNSRRTILVLTPRYVESEFTRFEYQMAQQEMLKKKHRIVPILLEDIGSLKESMDPNLKQIIGSVTYLEYPTDLENGKKVHKFWKRLELSLPKKRAVSENRNTSSSEFLDSLDSNNIQISVIENETNKMNSNSLKEKSESDIPLDVIKISGNSEKSENDSKTGNHYEILKLPLERNRKNDLQNVKLDIEKDVNRNENYKDSDLDLNLNIERYITMMEC